MGPDLPTLLRDLHFDGRLHDHDVLRVPTAPSVSEQTAGQGEEREGSDREGVPLLALTLLLGGVREPNAF